MRDPIRFQANIPEIVAFESPGTLSTTGRPAGQYQYFCTSNRIMWVEPVVHAEIIRLGVNPGEEFEICKTVRKEGRSVNQGWHVGWPGANNGQLAVPKLPPRAAPEPAMQTSRPQAQGSNQAPVAPIANGASLDAQSPTHPTTRREEMRELLSDALWAAIRAVHAEQSRAAAEGIQVKLGDEQIQDLVSTIIIDRQRRDEARLRYGLNLPYAQPKPNGVAQPNGHANGGQRWA
jgi:hypothetical protein